MCVLAQRRWVGTAWLCSTRFCAEFCGISWRFISQASCFLHVWCFVCFISVLSYQTQNRLRTYRPMSSDWWGTRGSGTAKITVTLCTRTGSSWTNRSMVCSVLVYSEFTFGLDCEKRCVSWCVNWLMYDFFRFHRQTHNSQNAMARHRLGGSRESCERRRTAFYSALEFHQGDKSISVCVCVFVRRPDPSFLVLDHIKADLRSDFRHIGNSWCV